MTRCSHEGIFYRVFYVTLLAIAFTFTVILTNVFIDIDGLLADKELDPIDTPTTSQHEKIDNNLFQPEPEITEAQNREFVGMENLFETDKKHTKNMFHNDIPDIKYTQDMLESNIQDIKYAQDMLQSDISDMKYTEDMFEPDIPDKKIFQPNIPNEKYAQNMLQQNILNKKYTEDMFQQETEIKQEKENNEVYQPNENIGHGSFESKPDGREDYRTKRSIDSPTIKFHLKNTKMKEILNSRLSTLLEELDAEETRPALAKAEKLKAQEPMKSLEMINLKKNSEENDRSKNSKTGLHMAMHNILLQGIFGHTDFNDVYAKVHKLIKQYEQENEADDNRRNLNQGGTVLTSPVTMKAEPKESIELAETPQSLASVETKFFNEMTNCKDLQKQINKSTVYHSSATRRSNTKKQENSKVPNVFIKTTIDIKSRNDNQNYTKVHPNNIKGLIRLIYNGVPVNFSRMEDEDVENKPTNKQGPVTGLKLETKAETKLSNTDIIYNEDGNIVDNFLENALVQYLKRYPRLDNKLNNRPKRSVKVRKHSSETTTEGKKKDDEELYVEIETHFDSKGVKGAKKRKLINDIIKKIQTALRANIEKSQNVADFKNSKPEMFHIQKRVQNPLEDKEKENISNKIVLPIEGVLLRRSDPISKSVKVSDPLPKVYDQMGEIWKRTYTGSKFLSNSKAINSGEMRLVDLDYSKVSQDNGIPQRLQQPLNSDNVDEFGGKDYYLNLGDLQFVVREIDGTGFSIGFNQYIGDAPDPETTKAYAALKELIDNKDKITELNLENNDIPLDADRKLIKRDVENVNKISTVFDDTQLKDIHENEYKIAFNERNLPYDSYSEIYEDGHKKVSFSIQKDENAEKNLKSYPLRAGKELPFTIDENIFKKNLKPSEIFGIASLLDRKKRSFTKMKKYSNLNTHTRSHINTYLNTKRKIKKIVMNKNKRNKRQVDKIRIIATDSLPRISRNSDENYYVVSNERMFADRAVVRDALPENEQLESDNHSEYFPREHISTPLLQPYNIFSTRSRQNTLMSKYPHLFLEELTRSKEEDDSMFYSKLMTNYGDYAKYSEPTQQPFIAVTPFSKSEHSYPSFNLYDGTVGKASKPNYKLTVKIVPKNESELPSGFKSVHTTINKTINRGGMVFLSQMNVSELSKVEQRNKDLDTYLISTKIHLPEDSKQQNAKESKRMSDILNIEYTTPNTMLSNINSEPLFKSIKEQQDRMKTLLNQHKKRIDEQLDNLKKEKINIDSLIIRNIVETATVNTAPKPDAKNSETIDVLLPFNPPQLLHLNRHEAGQLISNALMKLHDTPHLNDVTVKNQPITDKVETTTATPKTVATTTTTSTTTTTTTTTQAPKRIVDSERLKLLKTIQRNENLTNTILYKIDRNTNMLQHFLQKLTDRLDTTTIHPVKVTTKHHNLSSLNSHFFSQPMPNLEVNKNGTEVTIPFVYAYQQPYPIAAPNNSPNNKPIASVVYQGHIHTNTYNLKTKRENLENEMKTNTTKFFLDDIESGFKIDSDNIRPEPYDTNIIKNTTEYQFSS